MKPPRYHRMFAYDRRLIPNAHLRKLEEGVATIEEAQERTRWTIGYPGWGFIYHMLLCHLDRAREANILETGANEGCTTIMLAQALADAGCIGRVHAVEFDDTFADKAEANLKAAGLESRARIVRGDTRKVLPEVLQEIAPASQPLRAVFLDASHLFDDVMTEFELVLPHLAPDALVLFDNTYGIAGPSEDQRVNGALKEIMARHGGNLINLEFCSWFTPGLAIWQRKPNL